MRPALGWLVAKATGPGSLVRHLARARDPDGFARLRALCDADPHVSSVADSHTVHRAAEIVAAKGGRLADITVGDVLELLDIELDTLASVPGDAAVFYRLLRTSGSLRPGRAGVAAGDTRSAGPAHTRGTDRPLPPGLPSGPRPAGGLPARTPADAGLHQPGKPRLRVWGCCSGRTWRRHHPGIDSLHLPARSPPPGSSGCGPSRRRSRPDTGEKVTVDVPRLNYRECLIPIRAFYLDLAQWAVEDPGRWAQWVVPCPVREEEVNRRKLKRHRKSRMDARTRERLPVLPILVRTVNERRKAAARAAAGSPPDPARRARSPRPGRR